MQCYTQGCERSGRAIQLVLSHVPEEVCEDHFAACTLYLCIPCQESFFFAAQDPMDSTTHFQVAIPAVI